MRPRIFTTLLLLTALTGLLTWAAPRTVSTTTLAPESLTYRVMYKWGLINKRAGTAKLTLRNDHDHYYAELTAASEPWADRFYCVRDTLIGMMDYRTMAPLSYEKIAHEGNDYKHDRVVYDYSAANIVKADCTRKVYKKGELRVDDTRVLESTRTAVDMLTSFYYMRTLPFADWSAGHTVTTDIFSGKQKETLSIVYCGKETLDINGTPREAYHITFKFTGGGGKKTSDDMDAWIAADSSRIPLRLEGKLPVGKVHCILEQ